jgi:hypothetical protein
MKEAEILQLSAEPNELKEIDSGIWALGKSMSKQAHAFGASTDNDAELSASNAQESDGRRTVVAARRAESLGTDSNEFKARAVALWGNGKTQAEAIQVAAEEMGIVLKQSYSSHPGSHFDRWRKQGFLSRESLT